MRIWKLAPIALLPMLVGFACPFGGKTEEEIVAEPEAALRDGNLPTAYDKYEAAVTENADSRAAKQGAAYTYLLAGKYSEADGLLAKLEDGAEGDALGEIKLRRAMVALAARELDSVKEHGNASGRPAGYVLAAEVHLADAESDEAIQLLNKVEGGGPVERTAKKYLELLESGDQFQAGLAEATALWALGQRGDACDAAEELVKGLETEEKGELLLIWAGRAATSDRLDVAESLLEEAEFADIPPDHAWRVQATAAIVKAARGDGPGAVEQFNLLNDLAPADGLADARATAAALCPDKAVAKQLVEGLESEAVARGLAQAGAGKAAKDQAPAGPLKDYLEGK